jgi:surface antigen
MLSKNEMSIQNDKRVNTKKGKIIKATTKRLKTKYLNDGFRNKSQKAPKGLRSINIIATGHCNYIKSVNKISSCDIF